MMFLFHSAFALELIAVVASTTLFVWALRNEGLGVGLAKWMGFILVILSVFSLLCTGYSGLKYWEERLLGMPMMHHSTMMPAKMGTHETMMQKQTKTPSTQRH